MNNAVDWLEIPVKDMARAKAFYSKVLGKTLQDMNMEGMEYSAFPWDKDSPGSGAALIKSKDRSPSKTGTLAYFWCEDLSAELARVAPAGGKVEMPKMAIGGSGFMATFVDTEGNRVALHSWK